MSGHSEGGEKNVVLEGLVYEPRAGRLDYRGIRYMLVRPETLFAVYRQIQELHGEACREVFFRAGHRGVSLSLRTYRETGILPPAEGIVTYMADMAAQLGWGRVTGAQVDADRRVITLELAESAFAHGLSDQAHPVCDTFRGAFAAIGEAVWEGPVAAEEEACAAQGQDRCRFVIRAEAV